MKETRIAEPTPLRAVKPPSPTPRTTDAVPELVTRNMAKLEKDAGWWGEGEKQRLGSPATPHQFDMLM